jgi:galacturan 1,4-alpha-galacturonidase
MPIPIKIAYLGGGSRNWARDLLFDLAQSPHLSGRIDLYDLDHRAAEVNAGIATRLFSRADAVSRFEVRAVRRLPDALRDADFVVVSIEPGPIELRYADLQIPLAHGILQPVGDTVGPGGLLRALRSIPIFAGFGAAIGEYCPKAWVINYTNPMTLCTAALHAGWPGIRAFGCCHEVFGTQRRLAELVARWFGVPEPARHDLRLDIAGVNHFTWATAAAWQGHDLFPRLREHVADAGLFSPRRAGALARANRAVERWFTSPGLIAFDLFRRFGALGAAGDRHLAEFVPWYLADGEEGLMRWGVVATPYAWRRRRRKMRDHPPEFYATRPFKPTGEEGVLQIEALAGASEIVTNVNLPNRGQMPGVPADFVVETYARFSHGRVEPVVAGPLPTGAQALVSRVIDVQRMTLEAGLSRDPGLAFQALLADPLVHLSTEEAWRMFRSMLRATRDHLPGWRIP